jgi:type IV fimbrial biogenesis protein FimT
MNASTPSQGFTIIELLVTVSIVALLVTLSIPSFRTATNNRQTHAVAEMIQTGLRLAQATAVQQGRPTIFCLTNSAPDSSLISATDPNPNCADNGKNWFIQTKNLFNDDNPTYVQGGSFANITSNVTITGPGLVTFSTLGRLSGLTATQTYKFSNSYSDFVSPTGRHLEVNVDVGGQIRMCDSARTASSAPDGC